MANLKQIEEVGQRPLWVASAIANNSPELEILFVIKAGEHSFLS